MLQQQESAPRKQLLTALRNGSSKPHPRVMFGWQKRKFYAVQWGNLPHATTHEGSKNKSPSEGGLYTKVKSDLLETSGGSESLGLI